MDSILVKPNFVCREVGLLPPRLAQCRISTTGPIPLRIAEQTVLLDQTSGRFRFDGGKPGEGLAKIHEFAAKPSPGAVLIEATRLPIEIITPFKLADEAGGKFVVDWEKYVAAVGFLRRIDLSGYWVGGFTLAGEKALPKLPYPPGKIMFLNLFDPDGKQIEASGFYKAMGYLLGRMFCQALPLKPEEKEVFAQNYSGSLNDAIDHYLVNKYSFKP